MRHVRTMTARAIAAGLAMAVSAAARAEAAPATEAAMTGVAPLVKSSNTFGFDLYARVRGASGNRVISPASLSTALVMTWGGARGPTADEMARVLGLQGNRDALFRASGALATSLQDPSRPLVFRIANRLFGDAASPLESAYVDATRASFGAALEPVDFRRAPEKARVRINDWVETQTEKRIRDLLPPGSVNGEMRLALVNAIYFLGDWGEAFDASRTRPRPFQVSASQKTDVPTMHRTGTLRFAQLEGYKALELPYKGGGMSMLLVLPDATDGLAAVEQSFTPAALDACVAALRPTLVAVALPKFEIDPPQALALADTLQAMGMKLAFDRERADFTGISQPKDPRDRLALAKVFHKAFVKVDEKGTEAAAASAVLMTRAGSAMPTVKPAEFRADHPFLFFIRDQATGLVVFLGRVSDPSAR